jgi:D,D-heptose 1,7-bisphosphate phosphatase
MQLIILAGGRGTRMGELARQLPKPMLPIAGKPLLEHQIELARRYGITDVILLTGHLGDVIEDYFGDGSRFGVRIRYHREELPLGTAGALKEIEDWIEDDFLVFYGDIVMDVALDRLIAFHAAHHPLATLVVHPNNHPHDSDLLAMDATGRITAFYPKPRPSTDYYRNLVNAALYVLSPEILTAIPRGQFADLGRDVFAGLVHAGQSVFGYNTPEYLADVGTPARFHKVEADLISGKVAGQNRRHSRPAVFLDRDGVLNVERGHITRAENLDLLPGVARAIRQINEAGYLAVVVTNQPGVAKGYFSEEELERIHARLETLLGQEHAWLDRIYYCPHHPEKGFDDERPELKVACLCRKPEPGMIYRAVEELNIDLGRSFLVGDRTVDIAAGANAGLTTILVRTGAGGKDGKCRCVPDHVCDDLAAAVDLVCHPERTAAHAVA